MKWRYDTVSIGSLVSSVEKWNPRTCKTRETFTYIDIASVDRETKNIEVTNDIFTDEAPSRARQLIQSDDVLVSTVRPNLNAVAQVRRDFDGATASTGFTVLRAKQNKLDSRYLYYWVRTPYFVEDMIRQSTGASYPAVSDSIIKKHFIPLPPINEQRRIAAILDKADAVRRKRKDAIALTEDLLRSAFLEMFGESDKWPQLLVGDICKVKGGKRLPAGQQLAKENTGYPYIRAGNLKQGTVTGEILYLNKSIREKIKRYTISSKDVYITIVGAYIGDVGIVPNHLDGANLTENAAKLVIETDKITRHFLAYFLRSELGQRQIQTKIKATGQPKFALFRIEELKVPIPPVDLQERFRRILEVNQRNKSTSKDLAKKSNDLFNSLLQRAFRGDL